MAYDNNLLIPLLCTFCLLTIITQATPNRHAAKKEAETDITATPRISNGRLYYPLNSYLYAVNPMGGVVLWKKNLQELAGITPSGLMPNSNATVSVVTPTVAGDLLIVGIYGPAVVVAVNISTGELVWSTRLSIHIASVVAMSGVFHKGFFYVGTSSLEEHLSTGQCYSFRGSFSKLNASTGNVVWQTYTLPDNSGQPEGYTGAALWGSNPAMDQSRNLIYVATGHLYSAPLKVHQCLQEMTNKTARHCYLPDRCLEPQNHSNSMLALDLETGKVAWSHRLCGCSDIGLWKFSGRENQEGNHDYEPPIVLTVVRVDRTTKREVVVAHHKSGYVWTLDRDNGDLLGFKEPVDEGVSGATWNIVENRHQRHDSIFDVFFS